MDEFDKQLSRAVSIFWKTRGRQQIRQGSKTGVKDSGHRAAVTGGKHLDGFTEICHQLFLDAGIPDAHVYTTSKKQLPGYFRAEKNWDLVVVAEGQLLAIIEFKAQVGPSFGNNFNNRTEEAIGNATDLWAAYREGAFQPSARPWLGYVFLLEDHPKSRSPVTVSEPHYSVFPEFNGASYAERYEILLTKFLRERMYDGAALLLSPEKGGLTGEFSSPNEEISFRAFAASLSAHAMAYAKKH